MVLSYFRAPGCHTPKPSPLLEPDTHHRLLWGNSCLSCRFQWSATSRAFPSTLPGFSVPWLVSHSPLSLPHPSPQPMYCHDLFTHCSSPETANNLKAETVSSSALGACVCVAGSRHSDGVCVNDHWTGGWVVGARWGTQTARGWGWWRDRLALAKP